MTQDPATSDGTSIASAPFRRMGKDEINELPIKRWEGAVQVCSEQRDLDDAIQRLQLETVLGFDTETRPAFKKGQSFLPALLQLAARETVYIFQLTSLGLPYSLRLLLSDPAITKVGVSLAYDLKQLRQIAPFESRGFVDLGLESKRLGVKNHGLRGLCAVLLGFRISKSSRTSNWEKKNLTPAQIRYAATDAWVGRELHLCMQELKTRRHY